MLVRMVSRHGLVLFRCSRLFSTPCVVTTPLLDLIHPVLLITHLTSCSACSLSAYRTSLPSSRTLFVSHAPPVYPIADVPYFDYYSLALRVNDGGMARARAPELPPRAVLDDHGIVPPAHHARSPAHPRAHTRTDARSDSRSDARSDAGVVVSAAEEAAPADGRCWSPCCASDAGRVSAEEWHCSR